MRVFDGNSISSLQVGYNVSLKDFKYKTSEQRFQKDPFFDDRPFLCHESGSGITKKITKKILHLSDIVSERVSKCASE